MGTRKSKHNRGRKRRTFRDGDVPNHDQIIDDHIRPEPEGELNLSGVVGKRLMYKDLVGHAGDRIPLPLFRSENPSVSDLMQARPRFMDGIQMMTGCTWSKNEHRYLGLLAQNGVSLAKSADLLGRSETSIAWRARDLKLEMPAEWRKLIAPKRKPRQIEVTVDLQYPYIIKPREEHADILAINDIVPKSLPSHIRADICQEAMLAVLEGRTTIEVMKEKGARWFVAQFYRNNFEDSGHAISLTGVNDDGEEYDVLEQHSAYEYHSQQVAERQRYISSMSQQFQPPTQIEDVYWQEVRLEQKRLHDEDFIADADEARAALDALDPRALRHLKDNRTTTHMAGRLKERYGLTLTRAVWDEMKAAVAENRITAPMHDKDGLVGWIRVKGRNIKVAVDTVSGRIITVLAPHMESGTERRARAVRMRAEALFA